MTRPELRKTCPNCGEEVLDDARVCKSCRHRFVGEPPSSDNIDSLELPARSWSNRVRITAFGFLTVIGIASLLALTLISSENQESRDSDKKPQITERELESSLEAQVRSRTGVAIDWIGCDEGGIQGEIVGCDITFENGDFQPIFVEIQSVEPEVRIVISLDDDQ